MWPCFLPRQCFHSLLSFHPSFVLLCIPACSCCYIAKATIIPAGHLCQHFPTSPDLSTPTKAFHSATRFLIPILLSGFLHQLAFPCIANLACHLPSAYLLAWHILQPRKQGLLFSSKMSVNFQTS